MSETETPANPLANRWLRGALVVIALLLLLIVFLMWRVATGAEPEAAAPPTPTATPTPSPSPTPSPTPTPTPTSAATPNQTQPAPPPDPKPPASAGPVFTSFAVSPLSPDCTSESSVELTFAWSSTGAVAGWIGVATTNAKTAPYDYVNPGNGSFVLSYQCSNPSETYTVTLEDSSGRLTHKTVTLSRTPAQS